MSNTSLKLEISEGQIQNAIAVALAESFTSEKKEAMVRDIVRAHLQHRENSYDKETLLAKRVGALMRQVAEEVLKAEVETLRPDIEKAIREKLGPQFRLNLIEQVQSALSKVVLSSLRVSVHVDDITDG